MFASGRLQLWVSIQAAAPSLNLLALIMLANRIWVIASGILGPAPQGNNMANKSLPMFKSPRAPHINAPKMAVPKAPHVAAEHVANQFGNVHPDKTMDANLTDMFEVQKHGAELQKIQSTQV